LGKDAGSGPTYATPSSGGSTGDGQTYSAAAGGSSSSSSGSGSGGLSGSSGNAGAAPNYVNTPANSTGGAAKPHGENIQEGGFDSGAPNASFNTDIGGKNDPGRAALQGLQKKDAQAGGDVGAGPRQSGVSNDGQFDRLGDADA